MNYLAHAALAEPEPLRLIGNWLGDAVKGPLPGELSGELLNGVAAHRAIDALADRNPAFATSRRRLFTEFSHYAGVLVDVLFDHILASEWETHMDEPLDTFVERTYATFEAHAAHLPAPMHSRGRGLVDNDVLRRYATPAGVREALRRMAPRLRRPIPLAGAVDILEQQREAFSQDFAVVFQALRRARPEP